jgi:hypothetical protein
MENEMRDKVLDTSRTDPERMLDLSNVIMQVSRSENTERPRV